MTCTDVTFVTAWSLKMLNWFLSSQKLAVTSLSVLILSWSSSITHEDVKWDAKMHPWCTPVHTLKGSNSWPPTVMSDILSWNCQRMLTNIPTLLLKPPWCEHHVHSAPVPRFLLKPHCDLSNRPSVMLFTSLCSVTLAKTLPATDRSEMSQLFPQKDLSPLPL